MSTDEPKKVSWTEERVARLAKLWADGLSASEVAAELGGVTRNAVIGKIHRLGLSGRAKTASKSVARAKRPARTNVYSRGSRSVSKSGKANGAKGAAPTPPPDEDLIAPVPKRLDLIDLGPNHCRWPIGDPQLDDFYFCGHGIKADTPYCEYHSKIARQPPVDRRRPRPGRSGARI